jgi:hypothetical protein
MFGIAGYDYSEKFSWRSAFLNVAMLLGGAGPVSATPDGSKLLADL